MWGDIQAQINLCLTEEILEELFEIPSTQRRLKEEEARLARQREVLVKQEVELTAAMTTLGAK